ncbi:MAG TPA: hypothetical protein VEA81_12215, partial [Burkholderiaceae bacterium]|nr:hypothetical protein [Burkholderiaceae bacterium]
MSDTPTFDVAVVGLDAQRLRLIETVFRHLRYNRYAFRLAAPEAWASADLLIACVDDPAGRLALERARRADPWVPSIAVGDGPTPQGVRHAIRIGDLTRQLLPILNRLVELDALAPGRAA